MALAELLATPKHVAGCKVSQVLATLGNEDRAVLERALANSEFSTQQILVALRTEGHSVGKTTLREHRNKVCCCEDNVWEALKDQLP